MPPKRKAQDSPNKMESQAKRTKAAPKKGRKAVEEVYSAQQKAAISQFMSFTSADRSTATRVLKSHNWDAQTAVNA
ncbi:hypothetical protein EK21DRAFT_118677 [Setomelanomma holmii]|uniref:Uncharacterized protein n=1 Tax=Setomelanomma holmii TaxID=210430 RepID=A0A9P4GX37_9PLEO|nr:hypothetical protein EK21DRAFT_118677 [Setomelanomma holmii]